MQSLIADQARSRAEYALLMSVLAAGVARDLSEGIMTQADAENTFRLTLEEYRGLPE